MIFHFGTQWLTFMAILEGSESVKTFYQCNLCNFYTLVILLTQAVIFLVSVSAERYHFGRNLSCIFSLLSVSDEILKSTFGRSLGRTTVCPRLDMVVGFQPFIKCPMFPTQLEKPLNQFTIQLKPGDQDLNLNLI